MDATTTSYTHVHSCMHWDVYTCIYRKMSSHIAMLANVSRGLYMCMYIRSDLPHHCVDQHCLPLCTILIMMSNGIAYIKFVVCFMCVYVCFTCQSPPLSTAVYPVL